MKVRGIVSLFVMQANTKKGQDNKTNYYDVAVYDEANGQAGNISCTESVYKLVGRFEQRAFVFEFNTDYKSFKLLAVKLDSGWVDEYGQVTDDVSKLGVVLASVPASAPKPAPGSDSAPAPAPGFTDNNVDPVAVDDKKKK